MRGAVSMMETISASWAGTMHLPAWPAESVQLLDAVVAGLAGCRFEILGNSRALERVEFTGARGEALRGEGVSIMGTLLPGAAPRLGVVMMAADEAGEEMAREILRALTSAVLDVTSNREWRTALDGQYGVSLVALGVNAEILGSTSWGWR